MKGEVFQLEFWGNMREVFMGTAGCCTCRKIGDRQTTVKLGALCVAKTFGNIKVVESQGSADPVTPIIPARTIFKFPTLFGFADSKISEFLSFWDLQFPKFAIRNLESSGF